MYKEASKVKNTKLSNSYVFKTTNFYKSIPPNFHQAAIAQIYKFHPDSTSSPEFDIYQQNNETANY